MIMFDQYEEYHWGKAMLSIKLGCKVQLFSALDLKFRVIMVL